MRRKHKRIFILVVLLLFISLIVNGYLFYNKLKFDKTNEETIEIESNITDISLNGFSRVTLNTSDMGAIALVKGCRAVVASTNEQQASSITEGLNGEIKNRPWVHDVIYDIIENYDLEVLMVRIVDMKDDWFFADLILEDNEGHILNVDCKPSDAIAIAVRTHSPIYINNTLLVDHGVNICN